MTAVRVDGRAIADVIKQRLRREVEALTGVIPPISLVSIEVGDNHASSLFVRNQIKAAESVGIAFRHEHLPADTREEALIDHIQRHNADPNVTGIIVQRPLPYGIRARRIQSKIHPDKDVEGLNPANMGFIVIGEPKLVPCTALAAIQCMLAAGIAPRGKEIAVIGNSEIVGKPIAFLLVNQFATVTVCHIATQDITTHTRKADVVFVAVGKPGLVTGDMIKPGATVIDIGINQVPRLDPDGLAMLDDAGHPLTRVVGDIDEASVLPIAGHLTPVPGGVGPVTVAMLLRNALFAARLQHRETLGEPDIDVFQLDRGEADPL